MKIRQKFSLIPLVIGTILFLGCPDKVAAESSSAVLSDKQDSFSLNLHMDYFEDEKGDLTIDRVSSPDFTGRFQPIQHKSVFFRPSAAPHWIRFHVINRSSINEWFLLWDFLTRYPDTLVFFEPDEEGGFREVFIEETTLYKRDFDEKRGILGFDILLNPGAAKTYYLKVQDEALASVSMQVVNNSFLERVYFQYIFVIMLIGAIIFFLINSIFSYISLQDKNYLYYIILLIAVLCFTLIPLLFSLFPDLSSWWVNRLKIIMTLIYRLSFLPLTLHFFDIRHNAPRLFKACKILLLCFLLVILGSLVVPFHAILPLSTALSRVIIAGIFITSLWYWRAGYMGAKIYTFSILPGVLVLLYNDLAAANLLPFANTFSIPIFYGLSIIQLFLLSFTVIGRYKIVKQNALQEKQRAIVQMQQVEKLKDEFLANTSHELRTPLHGIIGLGENLLEKGPQSTWENQAHDLKLIIQSGQRLSYLIDDILDFSKIKRHELTIQPAPTDLKSACDLVVALCRTFVGNKPVELISDVPDSLPLVKADANRLQQILHNLIGNAVKFTHKGEIRISAEEQERFITIYIKDTGIGIPAEKTDSIFQPFYQVEASLTRSYSGAGLGLSITRQLVAYHGGKMDVASTVGEGSVFSFTLPVADPSETELSTDTSPAAIVNPQTGIIPSNQELVVVSRQSGEKGTILVVDDEIINLQVLQNHLSSEGYTILTAQNGHQAWDAIQSHPVDMIVLDLMMPGMNGFELCRKIREGYNLSDLPVIILTAKTQVSDLMQGFESGANDYLTKPVSRDELLTRVKTHFQLKKLIDIFKENKELKEEIGRRKQAEMEMISTKHQLIKLLDVSEEAILMVNGQKQILFFNLGAEQLFGYETHEILNQSLDILIANFPDIPTETDSITRLLEPALTGIKRLLGPLTALRKDQSGFMAEVLFSPIEFEDGKTFALVCREIPNSGLSPVEPDMDISKRLTQNRQKIQVLQNAFDGVAQILNMGGKELLAELRDLDTIMEDTFSTLSKEELRNVYRQTIVDVMNQALDCWVLITGKDKIELAEKSKLWSVYLDKGSYTTRTLDKYISLEKLPENPRWKDVVKTARFVLDTETENQSIKNNLQSSLSKLNILVRIRSKTR